MTVYPYVFLVLFCASVSWCPWRLQSWVVFCPHTKWHQYVTEFCSFSVFPLAPNCQFSLFAAVNILSPETLFFFFFASLWCFFSVKAWETIWIPFLAWCPWRSELCTSVAVSSTRCGVWNKCHISNGGLDDLFAALNCVQID